MERKEPVIGAIGLGGESVFLSVDHFHAPGETLQAKGIFVEPGGKAYNQAVAAARLGAKVFFFGAVGADSGSVLCRDTLESEGIIPVLQTIPDTNTAYACILTDRNGENQVTVSRGAANLLSSGFLYEQESVIAQCTHLLLGLECPIEATAGALELAKKHGIFTILNPAPAIPLDIDFLQSFDLITPNLQEATVLLGLDHTPEPDELAQLLCNVGLTNAVVTLGIKGSLLITPSQQMVFPALPVTAVDTTGAGDTFNAALAVAISRGQTMTEAIEFATNASAWSVCRNHVLDSLPTANELANNYRKVIPYSL